MRLERQLIAFGGIVLVGSLLASAGPVLAFGQQWRPAPGSGYGTPPTSSHQRVANMPSFRPHSAARPAIARPGHRFRRDTYRRPVSAPVWQAPPQMASRYGYPQPLHRGSWGNARDAGWSPFPAGHPSGGWADPFTAMLPPWGRPPLFVQQYGWRPAHQPWMAQQPATPSRQYRRSRGYVAPAAPRAAAVRLPGAAPVVGSWRPMLQAARIMPPLVGGYGNVRAQTHDYGLYRQPMFRSAATPGHQLPRTVSAARPYWRPDRVVAAVQQRVASPFRPRGYGRPPVDRAEQVQHRRQAAGITNNRLPGWVTTYQDTDFNDSCDWCSGS